MPKKTPILNTNESTTFNHSYEKLQTIIAWFEQEDLDLDEGMKKFVEGSKLIKELKTYLQTMENRIQEINQE